MDDYSYVTRLGLLRGRLVVQLAHHAEIGGGGPGKLFGAAGFMIMAKLTRSQSLGALAESEPVFTSGSGRFSIGIISRESNIGCHLHLSEEEAADLVAFMAQRRKVGA
jgi:hypothetical protein